MLLNDEVTPDKLLLELVVGLDSARRIVRSYPKDHPLTTHALQKVMITCQSLLQLREELIVGVARETFIFDGMCLASSTVGSKLAEILSQRGIGAMILHPWLDLQDLAALVSVLMLQREEILCRGGITKVWSQQGLTGISLVAIRYDLFQVAEVAEISQGTPNAQQAAVIWEEFVKRLTLGQVNLANQRSPHPADHINGVNHSSLPQRCHPGGAGDTHQVQNDQDCGVLIHREEVEVSQLLRQEHRKVRVSELQDLDPVSVEDAVEKTLLVLLDHNDDHPENMIIEEGITQAFRLHVETGDYGRAADILQEALAPRVSLQTRERLTEAFTSEGFLAVLMAGLRVKGKRAYPEAQRVISLLGDICVPGLLHHLAEEKDMWLRKFIVERIIEFGQPAKDEVVGGLLDSRWYLVRNLLVILRGIKDPSTVPSIRPLLSHRNRMVRQEAMRSLLQLGDAKAYVRLIKDLEDRDRRTRLSALTFCSSFSAVQAVFEPLAKVALKPGFTRDIYQEREAAVAALAESRKPQAVEILLRVLHSQNVLAPALHRNLKSFCLLSLERYIQPSLVLPIAVAFSKERGELGATASGIVFRLGKRAA